MSTQRDGFQTLYKIATQAIPALNNKPIPSNLPKYDGCRDIFGYAKLSRNSLALEFIKKKEETENIEKSESFINELTSILT